MQARPHPQFGVLVDLEDWEAHEPVSLLPEAEVLTEIYIALRASSAGSGFGPAPIGWPEMYSYSRLTRTRLNQWAINCLRMADSIYLRLAMERQKRERDAPR